MLESPFYAQRKDYSWLFRRIRNKGVVISKHEYDSFILPGDRADFQKIPCGKCIGCRLAYSRQWADRIMLESTLYREEDCYFFTVTYDDAHLPPLQRCIDKRTGEIFYFFPLLKRDLQLFLKNLRTRYYRLYGVRLNLRYFACGEFGDKTNRPHFHLCVMNLPLFDLRVSEMFCQKRDGRKIGVLYESDFINSCWMDSKSKTCKGGIAIGRLTWASAAYVARYIFKKQLGKSRGMPEFVFQDAHTGSDLKFQDQFTCMSLKPGIGALYFDLHKLDIVFSDQVPVHTKSGVQMHKPPRYFDSKTKELYPDIFDDIKAERRFVAISARLMELEQISLTEDEYLLQQEEIKMRSLRKLVRSSC
ncbi:replication initiator protein [Sigmofec virus UA08Rod_6120]|uniref:Replication initiator protein n=1 Tax=Sigmofec virus UA08Rod_6120 TaxID=2929453 RepID=A0A976N0Q1_9VIRU|nr:replication initiator protein [Sigmofec virus UA08Rod_6120]